MSWLYAHLILAPLCDDLSQFLEPFPLRSNGSSPTGQRAPKAKAPRQISGSWLILAPMPYHPLGRHRRAVFTGAARILGGVHVGPGNAAFDAGLRAQNPSWGIRELIPQDWSWRHRPRPEGSLGWTAAARSDPCPPRLDRLTGSGG